MPLSYEQAVHALESRGVMPERPPALVPTQEGMKLLRLDIDPSRVIVVAGTNGKGSVCATLEALLLEAGQTTGLYTSPHLIEHTERIRVNGQDISRELFTEAYEQVSHLTRDIALTHFEALTLMAAWVFFKNPRPVDWAIFEVGLGGLWDATNAIPHDTAVITALGLDHLNLLGPTLSDVARNKFGIIHKDTRVVHAKFPEELGKLVQETKSARGRQWLQAPETELLVEPGPKFCMSSPWGKAELKLAGKRAAQNSSLALSVFEALGFDPGRHLSALSKVRWPGRMELVANKPVPTYLSGDHNPQGIESLLELLEYYPRTHLHILAGVGREKDADGVLAPLFDLPNASVYLTEIPFRPRTRAEYGAWADKAADYSADSARALRAIQAKAKTGEMILITGSLYLVGQARALF